MRFSSPCSLRAKLMGAVSQILSGSSEENRSWNSLHCKRAERRGISWARRLRAGRVLPAFPWRPRLAGFCSFEDVAQCTVS